MQKVRDYLARYRYTFNDHDSAEFMWEPKDFSSNPFKPFWNVTVNSRPYYVTHEGEVIGKVPIVRKIEPIRI